MRKITLLFCLLLQTSLIKLNAQYAQVYPVNWFTGMHWNHVQLLVHGTYNEFNQEKVNIQYPGVELRKITPLENGKYLALDVFISPSAKSGKVSIVFTKRNVKHSIDWILKPRGNGNGKNYAQGVTAADFIYFLMPDRFSNGDESNDHIKGMRDQSLNRDSIFYRHGGDLQGIINHLDYLQQLGVTTLWMTPVLENDMPTRSEHGYAFTDHYNIEPRFGGADKYKQLSDELHKRGMKLIQDAVYNHVGRFHFTFQDPPMKNWFHQWPSFTQTSYKDQPLFDPYASQKDKKIVSNGWFTTEMPDLNQTNPFVANFLIQHALWSVEEFGVDGWRIDTYIYNDLDFMNRCNKALSDDFPKITYFGENWVHGVVNQAYFTENNMNLPFKSNLQGSVDFQLLFYGIQPALMEPFGWNKGVTKLYTTLSKDFIYKDPSRNVIFLDNHDMTRFFTTLKEDFDKAKMGIGWLLTCRGIPQMYYGTEILMKGEANPDGWVRLDFPGGWKGDQKNAFNGKGLSTSEKEMQIYVKTLANFRKHSSALKSGKLMQYLPDDGLYVYFRYDSAQTIMCIMNTGTKDKLIDFPKYAERTSGFTGGKDVITGNHFGETFTVSPKTITILALDK